jgi:hypothetical protein
MKALGRTLVVATVAVAVALICSGCGASTNNAGVAQAPTPIPTTAPSPTAAANPTPTALPMPTPQVITSGDFAGLEHGRRYAFPSRGTNSRISFVAPSGWTGNQAFVSKAYGDSGPVGPLLFPWPFDHGFKDPCTDHTPVLPAAGSGAAGLLGVIAGQSGIKAGPITDVTVGGRGGKYVDYTVTADPAACGNGEDGFWIWGSCPTPVTFGCENVGAGDRRYGISKGDRERAYAIDVAGGTVTFFGTQPADLLAADRAEFQQLLDSIAFEPAG